MTICGIEFLNDFSLLVNFKIVHLHPQIQKIVKKVCLLLLFALLISKVNAQNLQLHYDLGKDRNYLTSTFEYFHADNLGSTFLFVDMDYDIGEIRGISSAYWEIGRSFTLAKSPFAIHGEYNGGFLQWRDSGFVGIVQINDAFLAGPEYNYNNEDFTLGITMQLMYKYIRDKHDASFQITGVWYYHFLKGKLSFTGFADFWKEDTYYPSGLLETEKTEYIFMAEPQLWFNIDKHFAIGSELEIGNNFAGIKGLQLNPTIGFKWTIE